jgi:RNA polymerase sigma-70 factor (family 1)
VLVHSIQPYSPNDFILSFRAGTESAFDHFFKTYYKRLCYFARRHIKDRSAIEDIVADSFIKLWHKRKKFNEETHLRNYLYTTVRHGCLRWLRNKKLHGRHQQQASREKETTEQSVMEHIVHAEFIQQVYQALECLPPACRTIFKKLYIEGKSIKETAAELQLAGSTVQNQKSRGIGLLRKRLFAADT